MIRSLRHPLLAASGVLLFANISAAQLTRSYPNLAPITVPASGKASPYGSPITVSGITGTVTKVNVWLRDVTHGNPAELRLILVGPTGQAVALYDATPRPNHSPDVLPAANHDDMSFTDGAFYNLNQFPQQQGFYRPYSLNGARTSLPAPAPPMPYPPELNAFVGTNPNGVWMLYVADQGGPASGIIAGGWTITIEALESNQDMIVTTAIGPSSNYGAPIPVSRLAGAIKSVTVTLNNVQHTYPDDLDVLLVAPTGKSVMLMSHAGGSQPLNSNISFTFSDTAATAVPDAGPLVDGATYKPASYPIGQVLPAPAPAGPYGTTMADVATGNPNGVWHLYVYDHAAQDGGHIGGWTLRINTSGQLGVVPDLSIVVEGTALYFALVRTGGTTGAVGATLVPGNQGATYKATPGVDFTLPNAAIPFVQGQTQYNLSILAINDATPEMPENCYLILSNPTGGAALASNDGFGLLIVDDDVGLWSVSPSVGIVDGGVDTTLTVTNAWPGATVTFGGIPTPIQAIVPGYENVSYVHVRTPAHAPGAVNVTFANPNQQPVVLANGYTYVNIPADSSVDTDGDGMPDAWELRFGLNPLDPSDAGLDYDGDGVKNLDEYKHGTHPRGIFKRYLAEGASGGFFKTSIALVNVETVPATVVYEFQKSDGTVTPYVTTVDALRRTTVDPATILGGAEFSTVIESDHQIVVDRTMIWPADNPYGSHLETSVDSPAYKWYLAEGATNKDLDLFYLLQNPGDVQATVVVSYDLPAPQTPIVKSYVVAPHSRLTIHVNDEDPALAWNDIAAEIEANQQIIVERSMYRTGNARTWDAGHEGAAVKASSTHWFFAEGATGNFFDLFLLLMNPADADATVQVSYLLASGEVVVKSYPVAAHARRTIYVDMEDPKLVNAAVSMIVSSNKGIVAERAMWWPDQIWYEAHDAAGATETGTRWATAEGEDGGANNTQTYILIANTSAYAGSATVTLLYEDGTQEAQSFPLNATSRFNVSVGVEFAKAKNQRFSAIVQSVDTGSGLPQIVVERSVYADGAGQTWNLGGSSLATKLQ